MSSDDPTDDELEREAARDVPLPHGGTGRHAPRLGDASRAINPRALIMAEAEGQARMPRPLMPYEVDPDPYRQGPPRQDRAEPAAYEGHANFLRALQGGRGRSIAAEPPPTAPARQPADAAAWDAYAAAALAAFIHHAPGLPIQDLAATAASCADALLDERRRRR